MQINPSDQKNLIFFQIYVTLISFSDTNDETCVPRTPCKRETKMLDTIFKDSQHFHSFKTCAKLIVILLKK